MKHKALKITLLSIAGVIIAAIVAFCCIWSKEISTIKSISKVEGNEYLYIMDFKADYDLDDVINARLNGNKALLNYVTDRIGKGIIKIKPKVKSQSLHADNAEHCTSFQAKAKDTNGYYYGRNYDFFKNPTLIVRSHPKNGYASMAMVDVAHIGLGMKKLPETIANKVMCLAAVYAPMDGINEKGLCTSIMALPKQPSQQNTGKPIAGTSILMRLFLDRCATVDEALALLETVDVCHDVQANSGYHYMVADAMGNAACIEFDKEDGWKTMIVRKAADQNSFVVTNHLLSEKYYTTEPDAAVGNPHSKSWWRYETVTNYLNERNGCLLLDEADQCLQMVHWKDLVWENGMIEDTQWSALYDQGDRTLYLRTWNEYDRQYTFKLK